jgi:hypothetical protein
VKNVLAFRWHLNEGPKRPAVASFGFDRLSDPLECQFSHMECQCERFASEPMHSNASRSLPFASASSAQHSFFHCGSGLRLTQGGALQLSADGHDDDERSTLLRPSRGRVLLGGAERFT